MTSNLDYLSIRRINGNIAVVALSHRNVPFLFE